MQQSKLNLFPRELVEAQVSTIDLLMAMYPSTDEMTIDSTTAKWLDVLRDWSTSLSSDDKSCDKALLDAPASLLFELTVDIDADERIPQPTPTTVQLSIEVPIRGDQAQSLGVVAPTLKVRLRQPTWMNKTQTTQVNASALSDCNDDVLATIDHLRAEAARHLTPPTTTTTPSSSSQLGSPNATTTQPTPAPLVRVWFYFPSLSTRSKRSDLVSYAPHYNLTGFVLAGKPGLLCLEGESAQIDEYMSFIKTESWSDIPSAHKKVSERVRDVVETRVFGGMQEITGAEWMERRGERGNRNDLRALEAWLDGMGLKGVVGRVVM